MPTFHRFLKVRPRPGRCNLCRRAIVWRLDQGGHWRPVNPEAVALRVERHPYSGVEWEVFDGIASHLWTCLGKSLRKRPRKAHVSR